MGPVGRVRRACRFAPAALGSSAVRERGLALVERAVRPTSRRPATCSSPAPRRAGPTSRPSTPARRSPAGAARRRRDLYYVRVAARTACGVGPASNEVAVAVGGAAAPEAPAAVRVGDRTRPVAPAGRRRPLARRRRPTWWRWAARVASADIAVDRQPAARRPRSVAACPRRAITSCASAGRVGGGDRSSARTEVTVVVPWTRALRRALLVAPRTSISTSSIAAAAAIVDRRGCRPAASEIARPVERAPRRCPPTATVPGVCITTTTAVACRCGAVAVPRLQHDAVGAIPGVLELGFGRQPRHVVGGAGRRRRCGWRCQSGGRVSSPTLFTRCVYGFST